jgi:hypothetical protein
VISARLRLRAAALARRHFHAYAGVSVGRVPPVVPNIWLYGGSLPLANNAYPSVPLQIEFTVKDGEAFDDAGPSNNSRAAARATSYLPQPPLQDVQCARVPAARPKVARNGNTRSEQMSSASPPEAEISEVAFVPGGDIRTVKSQVI